MCNNFLNYLLSVNNRSLSLNRRSGSVNIDLLTGSLPNSTPACLRFYAYAVLYNRSYERTVQSPELTKSLSPSEEQIDQPKRQILRAGIAATVAIPVIYLGLESLLSPQRAIQNTKSLLLSQFQQRLKNIGPRGFEDPRLAPL